MKKYIASIQGTCEFKESFNTREEAEQYVDEYNYSKKPWQWLQVEECEFDDEVEVKELTSREFDTLVDLIYDNPDMEIDPNETKDGVVVLRFPKINGCFMCLRSDFDKACDYINGINVEF